VPIKFEEQTNTEFTPFSRALSNFFYANYYGADLTFHELGGILKTDLDYLIEPNLHDYSINEMQLEFAEGEIRENLLAKQKELNQTSYKAWQPITVYLRKLNETISVLLESNNLNELKVNNKNWVQYI